MEAKTKAEPPTIALRSSRFGAFEVPEESVFSFADGLIGFPGLERFVVIDHRPGAIFKWMLSLDDPELGFAIADPVELVPGYRAPREQAARAVASRPEDVVLFALLTIPANPTEMTINLMAPIAVNVRTRCACQLVLEEPGIEPSHRVLPPSPGEQRSEAREPSRASGSAESPQRARIRAQR